jgi:hypothetical protein
MSFLCSTSHLPKRLIFITVEPYAEAQISGVMGQLREPSETLAVKPSRHARARTSAMRRLRLGPLFSP